MKNYLAPILAIAAVLVMAYFTFSYINDATNVPNYEIRNR